MADLRSALRTSLIPGQFGAPDNTRILSFSEAKNRDLVQVSAWPDTFTAVKRTISKVVDVELPRDNKIAAISGDVTIFQIAPNRLWLSAPHQAQTGKILENTIPDAQAVVTSLGHSRTIIQISGSASAELLMRGLPIDLDPEKFVTNAFVQSAIHHVPVLVHRKETDEYEIHVARGYAVTTWLWLTNAATSFGYGVS